jgi:hypothetical protein
MTRGQKILFVLGFIGLGIGGFALAKYLTRNTVKIVGGTVELQTYNEPPNQEPEYKAPDDTSMDDNTNDESIYGNLGTDSSTDNQN